MLLLLLLVLTNCAKPSTPEIGVPVPEKKKAPPKPAGITILIQPLDVFSPAELQQLTASVYKEYGLKAAVGKQLHLPKRFISVYRSRYRADSIIGYLHGLHGSNTITVGVIKSDISTTLRGVQDWGVMGLGYQPGNACVISTFRLHPKHRASQFPKVVIHEIGHNFGLPHCPQKTCLMRDAKGGNPFNEAKGFCTTCAALLRSKNINVAPAI